MKSACFLTFLFFHLLIVSGSHASCQTPAVSPGPDLAGQAVHSIDKPAQLVTGNGDVSLMWEGPPSGATLSFGKADFWGVVRGSITTAGGLHLTCKEMQGATFQMQQNVGQATVTGSFSGNEGTSLKTKSWIAYPENLIVTELANSGARPLHFTSSLVDGFQTAGLPSTSGSNSDSTWIQVSPDLVEFKVGNRPPPQQKPSQPVTMPPMPLAFAGKIAGLTLTSPEDHGQPFLNWDPTSFFAHNAGNSAIEKDPVHGDTVTFTGQENQGLALRAGCIPQAAFTFLAWVNPSAPTADGTIFSGIAVEKPQRYPYFRGFLVHLVNGVPEVRLNYYTAKGSVPLPLNQWSEIKAVYAKQLLTLFINGQQVAQDDNPPASAEMGWDKATIRLGDPALPFNGCAPQAMLRQRVVADALGVKEQTISFEVQPGKTGYLLVSLVSNRDSKNYEKVAETLANSDPKGIEAFRLAHDNWWHSFWSKSYSEIPDKRIQDNWYGSLYVLACCSRANCPPPGLWYNFVTKINAPWDGDYTLDYNYQAPFWAAYATNHFELADNYEGVLLDHISRGESIAANAWRFSPVKQPASLEDYVAQRQPVNPPANATVYHGLYLYTHLIPTPGWSDDYGTFWQQKSNALFCCVNLVQRYRLTQNLEYGRKVYPFLKGTADFWDNYLELQDGRYVDLNDAVCENSGFNKNPATTLSFLKLLYPVLIELSEKLNLDSSSRAKWHDILDKLSPFTFFPASSIGELTAVPADVKKDKWVIRDSENGPDFPRSPYLTYQNRKPVGSSAGMNCTQTIFPGWTFGAESPDKERQAALNTVTFAAEWYDNNNDCTFYPAAAAIGYDPKEILTNLRALIETTEQPDFTLKTFGGGTEDDSITPVTLASMFVQSYQTNIHLFPNWPNDMDARFGDLTACGGFLVSGEQKQGEIVSVQITSLAGQACHLMNPWPGKKVLFSDGTVLSGDVLSFDTKPGQKFELCPIRK